MEEKPRAAEVDRSLGEQDALWLVVSSAFGLPVWLCASDLVMIDACGIDVALWMDALGQMDEWDGSFQQACMLGPSMRST